MGSCTAARFAYVELGNIRVSCKYHVACSVGDTVVGISGKVIKDLEHVRVSFLGGLVLLLGKLTEGS